MPPVRTRIPVPVLTFAWVELPSLTKLSPARVWLKLFRLRMPAPRISGMTLAWIWLAASSRTVAPLMMRSPAGMATVEPALAPVTLRPRVAV